MSAKDSMAKEYFADNARFADLCNNILYGGREVILPENLKERDTTEVLTALGLDKKTIAMQKMRDIFQKCQHQIYRQIICRTDRSRKSVRYTLCHSGKKHVL